MINPPINEIQIEHPNQEENENKWDTILNFLNKIIFLSISRSNLIMSPEYLIDRPTQIALVSPNAHIRISCRVVKKAPPVD
jgi:hypothetical protein